MLGAVQGGTDENSGSSKKTQVMGAVAVTVGENSSQALIDTGAVINAGWTTEVNSSLKTDVYTFGDGRASAPGDDTDANTALGAGVAVAVVDGEGRADLKGTVLSKHKINVASASAGTVKTEAKAGYSKGDIGIGGAVAVQVGSMDSKALMHGTADIKTNSRLVLDADSDVTFSVNADSSGKTAQSTGVGAGVAVAVDGADTYAAIQDGMKMGTLTSKKGITGISITASNRLTDIVKALNGAAGGTSVIPVAAVNVSGTGTEAYLGKISGDTLKMNGSVMVSAKTNANHQMKADATAAGQGAAVGAGVSVSVVSDEANARLNQSLKAKDVTVAADTISSLNSWASATASGGKQEGKIADRQADGLVETAEKLASKNKSDSVSKEKTDKAKSDNRQQAQTSEGTVGVAGAVAVNVQDSVSCAEIMQGVNVKASGTLSVTSQNGTKSGIKADASAVNSDIGVGVGVAVNIIGLQNIAQISDGAIEAAILKVTAATRTNGTNIEDGNKETDQETLYSLIQKNAEGFISDLMKDMGLGQYVSADQLAKFQADMVGYVQKLKDDLSNLTMDDVKTKIGTALRTAAKNALVSVSNEALSAMSDRFDLTLEASKPKATGHAIDTQAISGAGAWNVGVAGSAAITVLNAETGAAIADGGAVKAAGDMTVDARELRSVNNVASAAVDKNGNAAANKNAGSEETKDAGGSSDAESVAENTKGTVKLTVGVGGTAEIKKKEETDNRPRVYITLKDGYKMPEGNKVSYSYDDGSQFEKTGELDAHKDGENRWYVDTNLPGLRDGILTSTLTLEVKPVAIDYTVPFPDVISTDGGEKVTVKAGDSESTGESLSAHVGDKVEIKVEKKEGRKVSKMLYGFTDTDGVYKEIQLAPGSETDTEITYTFDMPAAHITDFKAVFDSDSGESAKDGTGKSIGVGAAFSMVYGESKTAAEIGTRVSVEAGTLTVTAQSDHGEDIEGAAGTDPLLNETDPEQAKKTAVDASVALNILDNGIQAKVAGGMTVNVTAGDLNVTAREESLTETTASAFSVGGKTAVGATAAVNIANTAVKAEMSADAAVAGGANVSARSDSQDVTKAIATALGADIARSLKKLNETTDNMEEKANSLLDGSIVDQLNDSDAEENKTADKINQRLNEKKAGQEDKKEDEKTDANRKNSLSSNVLRTQDVKAQGENAGGEGAQEAEDQIKDKTGQDVSASKGAGEKKWQVAAAVGVTVSDHAAETTVGRIVAGKAISVTAENTGNFNTLGTAAAMSRTEHANSIATGVAVSVNRNRANTRVNGDLVSNGQENITVTSHFTQNLDGDFAGKLAAQALSSSVASKDSSVSIAGAVSVLVSHAESTVDVAGNHTLSGGDITLEATDKSKLAIRAGGVSLSGGSSFGMGLSSATVVSGNKVTASLGDGALITGKSFKLNAEKLAVTGDDYKNLINQKYLVTDSSALTEEQRKEANTGLIDMHKDSEKEGEAYKVEIGLSSDKLLDAMDGLNFLSSQNTYVEAIAGSVMTGKGKTNLAGSFAVTVTDNEISAVLGKGANITLTGDMRVTAKNGTEEKPAATRIIAGSLSAGPAKTRWARRWPCW
ncbi:MAG: hypothetical protein IKH57_13675 [Clostridia bacterium]|nr:hypothetical protein [Clostridia bacterium]